MRYRRKNPLPPLKVEPLALAIPEVAAVLRVSPEFVRLQVRKNKLRATHLGSRLVIRRSELDRYLDENTTAAGE